MVGEMMVSNKKCNILYVLHSGTAGGTFQTNKDLMKNVEKEYNVFLLAAEEDFLILYSYIDNNLNIIKKFPRNFTWSAMSFHDSWLTYVYYEILTQFNINLIHIRHLIYHSFDLPMLAKKLGIGVVLSFHDFYFICPNYFLLNEDNKYCEAKCLENNRNCNLVWDIFDDIHFKTILPIWRKEVERLFGDVDFFVTTSDIVKQLFLSIYNKDIINDSNFKVIEHGRDFPKISKDLYEIPSNDSPLKIVFPSNHLNETKGLEIIKKIKEYDYENNLEFHFLGDNPKEILEYGIDHGSYERDNFHLMIEKIKPSFIGVFSIWPETFCHTITEAWSCGIPVIGTNIGVIEDRIHKSNCGFTIDMDNLEKSYDEIVQYKYAEKNKYLDLINNISNLSFKTTKEMSDEYLEIYKNILDKG